MLNHLFLSVDMYLYLVEKLSSGRFKSRSVKSVGFRNSLTFLIARSIYMKGLEPTYFFTDAFETAYKKLPSEFIQKYELDIDNFLKFTTT